MDPLSKKNGPYKLTNTQNSIVDAFEAAASSFAVFHKIPGAKYYEPPSDISQQNVSQPEEPPAVHLHQNVSHETPKENQPEMSGEKPTQNPSQNSLQKHQNNEKMNQMPVPSNTLVYPPPLPEESDPDRMRLLHSWYWAGYYTGLADGKRIANQS
ncbi:hypothetical protein TRFO_04457 [Tritrichomonas foetus]|uniref:Survival motor neuron Tudor domain-containing protein n=1 Tax=Tritrichomonas foetus TaxID=1144522 RepID=A0A1J4KEN8_9EUKA|nr:hypothetical protein TRFO_04457 [Tritrichomonas foetus]|eukprot:OHT09905.1 hypothetical protein TRFO_04457 [Tritrichomonas foetus]